MFSLENLPEKALSHLSELALAPAKNPEMLWIAIPLLGTLLLMEVYFSRHNEKLGWNTAFGNGIILLFVAFDLLRKLYSSFPEQSLSFFPAEPYLPKSLVIAFVFLYALAVLSINFFRTLPDFASFTLSSYPVTIVLAYVAVAIIYSNIEIEFATLFSVIILYVLIFVLLLIQKILMSHLLAAFFPSKAEKLEREAMGKINKGEL